jgi:hypothetical protein
MRWITGNSAQVQRAMKEYGQRAERVVGDAVQATAIEMRSDVQRAIERGPKTGRVYTTRFFTDSQGRLRVGEDRPPHQASAPGEAPASDTGTLVSSIVYRMHRPLTAYIESRLPYAAMLEFGTSRMAPRPSWTPAAERAQSKLNSRIVKAIRGLQ